MKTPPLLALSGLFLSLVTASFAASDSTATIAFSSPDKPGTLVAVVSNGTISVRGADVDTVTIRSEVAPEKSSRVKSNGMRVLGSSSQFSVDEKDNVITLNYGRLGWSDDAEFEIIVPRNTNLTLQMNLGGEVSVANVTGNVDIKNLNGEVDLENLGGGAIVESMNGEISASFTTLPKDKPIALSSMNGEITVRLPGDAAADVRFRTQNGTIMTDFDDAVLVTKTESGSSSSMGYTSSDEARRQAREIGRAAAEAARAASEIAREAAREAERVMRDGLGDSNPHPAAAAPALPAMPAMPAMPAIPTLAGGKVISGKLNGGGTSLQIATMNGDIILRHRDSEN